MDSDVIVTANELRKIGISILIANKHKKPVGGSWKDFETRILSREELDFRCSIRDASSLATIGGRVSGGLETIDFEGEKKVGKCCFHEWEELIKIRHPSLFSKLVINSTPNGGYHVRYRYFAERYDTRLDLARISNPSPGEKQKTFCLIETRGEAHYALCPPSPGYKMIQGKITEIPFISVDERNLLITIAKSFNEVVSTAISSQMKPGTDFNERGDHQTLLERHGWSLVLRRENGIEYWRRPGKEEGWSATWNFIPNRFYPFSTNAEPFEEGKSYDKFALFSYLEYGKNFGAAAQALREKGFGEQLQVEKEKKPETDKKAVFQNQTEFSTPLPLFPAIAWRSLWEDFRLAHTETTEAPDEFLFASASAALGAIMGRKAWIWYARKLYPNFFLSIVGTTARTRKTTVAEKAHDLLARVDSNVLYYRGLASAEGLIQLLSPLHEKDEAELEVLVQEGKINPEEAPIRYRAEKARLAEKTTMFEGFRLLGLIGEFSSLLKKSARESSQGLTETLIDAYDNPPKLDNPTRTSPLSASYPSVSILTTTTKGRLFRNLMKEEIEGGFANRFAYFIGDRKRPIPFPPEPKMEYLNRCSSRIAASRRKWHNTQFQLLKTTLKIWNDFYHWWFEINDGDTIDQFTGRLPDHALKLALQYAIVENETPEILPDQMEAAVEVARYWYEGIRLLFTGFGLTENQQLEQQILMAISNGGKSKEDLYRYFSRNIDAKQLNSALENLQKVSRITQEKQEAEGKGKRPKTVFRLSESSRN